MVALFGELKALRRKLIDTHSAKDLAPISPPAAILTRCRQMYSYVKLFHSKVGSAGTCYVGSFNRGGKRASTLLADQRKGNPGTCDRVRKGDGLARSIAGQCQTS